MTIIRVLLCYIFLCNLPAWAWQVSLQQEEKDKPIQIAISNNQNLQNVDIYLVWFDKDNAKNDPLFISWVAHPWPKGKWQKGLKPIFTTPLDIEEFSSLPVSSLEPSCPKEHRCFLAFVATLAGHDPSLIEDWQASSILPLSLEAGQDRLPGQNFFLPTDSIVNRNYSAFADEAKNGGATTTTGDTEMREDIAPASPGEGKTSVTETEKPDIFKVAGSQVLYANGAAERFQIIDIADPAHLQFIASSRLIGSPREIYTLGQYYILLQSDDFSPEPKTYLTVLTLDEEGKLLTHQEIDIPGQFKESRRRGEVIYTVTETFVPVTISIPDCPDCDPTSSSPVTMTEMRVKVNAFRMTSEGKLQEVDKEELSGYSPQIAIFPDYLAIATSDSQVWNHSQVFLFDLTQPKDPLKKLPMLNIPGRIPSEFHMDVKEKQFRVVYGPENVGKDGSTLAIYDLSTQSLKLLGQVDKIAPGEDLFATRFMNERAFVVTYERKDPLWVIDLANPRAPKILGELEVPGWSEKLFFNEDRLFAVGIDDQPLETEKNQWVRRVALSLFDVSHPTQPTLVSKFIPLVGKVTYSYSLALQDERALLLDWEDALAALPIEAYEHATGAHLQILSLSNNKISDAGLLESPVLLQRSTQIGSDLLAALGDQALYTVRWGLNKKPEIVGELELASNVTWLTQKSDQLFAAGWGNQGLYRLYRYHPDDLETPTQNWRFSKGYYGGVLTEENLVVFYDYSPLAVQALDVESGKLYPPQALETATTPSKEGGEVATIAPPTWYNRTQPLLYDGWMHIGEQQVIPVEKDEMAKVMGTLLPIPPDQGQSQWVLRSWKLFEDKEMPARSIPGQPLAFTNTGYLVTHEATKGNQLRLNLLSLEPDSAKLVTSRDFDCRSYSPLYWVKEAIYVRCDLEDRYYGPIVYANVMEGDVKAPEENNTETSQPKTILLKVDPKNLTEIGSWKFSGYRAVQTITSDDLVLLASEYGWYYRPFEGELMSKPAIMPPLPQDTGCDVYQLTSQADPSLIKHLETCPYGSQESIVLTPKGLWVAEGFKGITHVSW